MNQAQVNLNLWQTDYANWIVQGTSATTRHAYQHDEKYFWQWVHQYIDSTLTYPISSEVVLQ